MTTEAVSLSQPIHKIKVLHDLKCPMRDGTELSTDVYMPAEGGPFPTLLTRTPYGKHLELFVPDPYI